MLRDQAYAFLYAGRHAEGASMMLRMLRVSIVPSLGERPAEGGPAAALLQAIGGLEAFRRSVPGPADAYPVARFLLFEPSYPHSVTAALELLHARLTDADPSYRTAPPLLRLARLRAELEFHHGALGVEPGERLAGLLEHVGDELSEADVEIEKPLLRRRGRPAARGGVMRFQITYWTGYEYSEPVRDNLNVLRVKPATTRHQTVDDFSFRVEPEARLHQYRDYFGSEVIEFGVTEPHERLGIEARMRVTTVEQEVDPNEPWAAIDSEDYRAEAGEYLLQTERQPANGRFAEIAEEVRGADAARHPAGGRRGDPGALRVPLGRDVRRLDGRATCSTAAPACARTSSTSGAMILRCHGIGARYVSGYLFATPRTAARSRSRCRRTRGSRACFPTRTASGAGSASTRPTAAARARRT